MHHPPSELRAGFDERAPLCDNPVAVTALRLLVMSVLLVACDTPSDLPHLQDEALAMVKDYEKRLDELARRVELIRRRGSAVPAEVLSTGSTGRLFRLAVNRLEEFRQTLQRIPGEIQGDIKAGDRDKLLETIAEKRSSLRHGVTAVTSGLNAVETAIASAERNGPLPDDPGAAPIR